MCFNLYISIYSSAHKIIRSPHDLRAAVQTSSPQVFMCINQARLRPRTCTRDVSLSDYREMSHRIINCLKTPMSPRGQRHWEEGRPPGRLSFRHLIFRGRHVFFPSYLPIHHHGYSTWQCTDARDNPLWRSNRTDSLKSKQHVFQVLSILGAGVQTISEDIFSCFSRRYHSVLVWRTTTWRVWCGFTQDFCKRCLNAVKSKNQGQIRSFTTSWLLEVVCLNTG